MTSARLSLLNCEKRAMNPHVQMMRHRLWIIAFTVMGAVAYYVIGALLYLSQQKQWSDGMWNEMTALQIAEQYTHYMQDHVRHFYGFCSYGFVVVIFLAIIMGIEGYAYLHKMQTMDFYESQPLSRGKRFTLIYLNGWKIFASIWGVATLLGVAIGALYGGMNVAVLAEIAVEFVFLCILFFGVYNITIFASTISKNNVVATFLTMIFLAAEAGYRLLAQELMEAYFPTYYKYSYISNTYNMKNWFTSPIANYVTGRMQAVEVQRYNLVTVGRVGLAVKNMMVSEVLALVIGVVFL
ncbi:MAG: hypothetical protein IKR14_02135, partial [Lachnospiraceae bacterium]|nr:hypothetical protein [Lachnospiraceae bacterium]